MATPHLFIDLETRSPVNLRTDGPIKYAEHPQTSLLTVSWSVDGVYGLWLPTIILPLSQAIIKTHLNGIALYYGPGLPAPLADNLHRTWVGHNVWGFDQPVWEKRYPAPADWRDTYPEALQHGLPGNLDAIGKRLGIGGKDETGKSRLSRFTRNFHLKPALLDIVLIGKYNVHDVRITEHLMEYIAGCPKQPDSERKVLQVHRKINDRGCRVDVPLMRAIRDLSDAAIDEAVQQIRVLTCNEIPDLTALRKRATVIKWLEGQGVDVDRELGGSIAKDSVTRWLDRIDDDGSSLSVDELLTEGDFNARGIRLLQLRQQAMRVTGGKIDAGIAATSNGRLHGLFAYWAAHTGRWGGRRIQVQNLPRPKAGVPVWTLIQLFEDEGRLDPETVKPLLGPGCTLDDAAAALLRGIFIPDDGFMLGMADYSAIEARVLAHLAGEESLLDCFINDRCPYSAIAARLFNTEVSKKVNPHLRHVGKTIELGCGYGMGPKKFRSYGELSGIDFEALGITPEQCVEMYRATHEAIAGRVAGEFNGKPYRREGLWHKLDYAAKEAMREGKSRCGPLMYKYDGSSLRVRLPSGRFLTYREARIEEVPAAYDPEKLVESLTYAHVRGYRTYMTPGKWAENVVQAESRDVMAESMVRIDPSYPVVMHVHDECVPMLRDEGEFDRFMSAFTTVPDWAPGLPLDAEGGVVRRYAKTVESGSEVIYRNGQHRKGTITWPKK